MINKKKGNCTFSKKLSQIFQPAAHTIFYYIIDIMKMITPFKSYYNGGSRGCPAGGRSQFDPPCSIFTELKKY